VIDVTWRAARTKKARSSPPDRDESTGIKRQVVRVQ
jgi:hypothetical protein